MTCSLGGEPILIRAPIRWALTTGTRPYMTEVLLHASSAKRVWEQARGMKPVTLRLGDLEISPVYVVGTGVGHFPDHISLTIADHRYLWPGCHVFSGYNLRESSGDRRWLSGQQISQFSSQTTVPQYVRWSLRLGVIPWKISEIWAEVGSKLTTYLRSSCALNVLFPTLSAPPFEPQDLQIDAPADRALDQVLSEIGVYELTLGFDGKIHIVDSLDRSDLVAVADGSNQVAMVGLPAINDRRNQRPRSIGLLFDLEVELRFNSISESSTGQTVARSSRPDEAELELENILPVVDPIAEISTGETYSYGSMLPQYEWLYSLGDSVSATNRKTRRAFAPELSMTVIREQWRGDFLMLTYAAPIDSIPEDVDWTRRIGAVYGHVRQTYRVVRQWKHRIRSWKPIRAAILDPKTHARAPSQVYADYAVVWGSAPNVKNLSDSSLMGVNIDGYADNLDDAKPAESTLSVLDQDQMHFHVSYDIGRWGGIRQIYPCQIDETTMPDLKPTAIGGRKFVAINQAGAMTLASGHKIAVVFSCIPACGSLYQIDVTPTQVEGKIGKSLGPCEGPMIFLRVAPGQTTARVAWSDGKADQLKAVFGQGVPGGVASKQITDGIKDLLLDQVELDDVAISMAAQYYSGRIDQGQGELALPGLVTKIGSQQNVPRGMIRIITVTVGTDGQLTTTLSMPEQQIRRSLDQLLSKATRQKLFKMIP